MDRSAGHRSRLRRSVMPGWLFLGHRPRMRRCLVPGVLAVSAATRHDSRPQGVALEAHACTTPRPKLDLPGT
jgi:hypothetical protein